MLNPLCCIPARIGNSGFCGSRFGKKHYHSKYVNFDYFLKVVYSHCFQVISAPFAYDGVMALAYHAFSWGKYMDLL